MTATEALLAGWTVLALVVAAGAELVIARRTKRERRDLEVPDD
jgi:hypothetical protein